MNITESDFEQFYFGNSNECYIQSEFYSIGYEAMKTFPDIGYDLIVTNCARTKFFNEERKQYKIQVKSTVSNKNCISKIFISEDDLGMLIDDKDGYLICVFCEPIFASTNGRIHINRDTVEDLINDDLDNHLIVEWEKNPYVSFSDLKQYETALECSCFSRQYIWFNQNHLKRLKELGALTNERKCGNNLWYISFLKGENSFVFLDKDKKTINQIRGVGRPDVAYELKNIVYLAKGEIKDEIFVGEIYY